MVERDNQATRRQATKQIATPDDVISPFPVCRLICGERPVLPSDAAATRSLPPQPLPWLPTYTRRHTVAMCVEMTKRGRERWGESRPKGPRKLMLKVVVMGEAKQSLSLIHI